MSSPDDVEDLDEMDVKIARAEETLIVRGRPQHEWWVELRRLEREGRWTEYEILLLELRDAVELSSKLVGWTVAPAPAKSLARLYLDQGNKKGAVDVLKRHLDAITRYRQIEPTGGDIGEQMVRKWLDDLTRNEV